jgi:hypothetical protein
VLIKIDLVVYWIGTQNSLAGLQFFQIVRLSEIALQNLVRKDLGQWKLDNSKMYIMLLKSFYFIMIELAVAL